MMQCVRAKHFMHVVVRDTPLIDTTACAIQSLMCLSRDMTRQNFQALLMSKLHVQGGGDGGDVQDEGPVPSSYPASGVSFPQATVPFCTQADAPFSSPNLADHGIGRLSAIGKHSMCAGLVRCTSSLRAH